MATPSEIIVAAAEDGYADYYTEKLWSWIPGFYRDEDAKTPTPGTLRALVESMGSQSAELRRSLDRIWENHFVELADDEALEALGALVATRMVHALNRRGRRVDVARTIHYRRRKGTPRVLESLATDISGWLGAHLDTRKRLARSYHLLEPPPPREQAIFTRTPRGGWANLRNPRIPALAWTAFEELSHTPDFRRYLGREGRFNIAKVGVHLHRARAFEVNFPTVVQVGADPAEPPGAGEAWKFTLDPSGREVPLFAPADRPSASDWKRVREWQVPKIIEGRLLDHAEYEWSKQDLAGLTNYGTGTIELLEDYAGWRFESLRELQALIDSFPGAIAGDINDDLVDLLEASIVPDCGRLQLYGPDELSGNQALDFAIGNNTDTAAAVGREEYRAGNLADWGSSWDFSQVFDSTKPRSKLVVDPGRGTVISRAPSAGDELIVPVLHYGFPGEIGAGSYDRRATLETEGIHELSDGGTSPARVPIGLDPVTYPVEEIPTSKTYELTADLSEVEDYRLQAGNFQRPYLLYSETTLGGEATTWTISAKVGTPGRLVLDGLWIGVEDDSAVPVDEVSYAMIGGKLVLANTWERVEIRNCTLDPGGEKILDDPTKRQAIQYVILELAGYIEELVIERSILGPILDAAASPDACSIGKLIIRDSVVTAFDNQNVKAINLPYGEVHIERSSIAGDVIANRIYVSDSLISGGGTITDLQHGCFRFSASVEGEWPRPYESHFYSQFDPAWFHSGRFGDPDFLRLTELAPEAIRTGAENHCEMGVWNHLFDEIKRADLRAKLGEFMPFDLIMQLVTEN